MCDLIGFRLMGQSNLNVIQFLILFSKYSFKWKLIKSYKVTWAAQSAGYNYYCPLFFFFNQIAFIFRRNLLVIQQPWGLQNKLLVSLSNYELLCCFSGLEVNTEPSASPSLALFLYQHVSSKQSCKKKKEDNTFCLWNEINWELKMFVIDIVARVYFCLF